MKIKETAAIISQECLCPGIYSMQIATDMAKAASPGQFISVYSNSDARLLPRPISICDTDGGGSLRIVYRVAGAGTEEFSHMTKGDTVDILGPNGNGFFDVLREKITSETKALLIGGGIGIPPMLGLAKQLSKKCLVTVVAGYRNAAQTFLIQDLERYGKVYVATDDGSAGFGGTVIDAIRQNNIACDVMFACGPKPMLAGVKKLSEEINRPAYVSMEERMACGIGACLGCVCASTDKDDHSRVNNKRVCADGPVFAASEVVL